MSRLNVTLRLLDLLGGMIAQIGCIQTQLVADL